MPKKVSVEGPRTSFLVVVCSECGSEQIIFSNVASAINCKVCNKLIAESVGGKSVIRGQVVKVLR